MKRPSQGHSSVVGWRGRLRKGGAKFGLEFSVTMVLPVFEVNRNMVGNVRVWKRLQYDSAPPPPSPPTTGMIRDPSYGWATTIFAMKFSLNLGNTIRIISARWRSKDIIQVVLSITIKQLNPSCRSVSGTSYTMMWKYVTRVDPPIITLTTRSFSTMRNIIDTMTPTLFRSVDKLQTHAMLKRVFKLVSTP